MKMEMIARVRKRVKAEQRDENNSADVVAAYQYVLEIIDEEREREKMERYRAERAEADGTE